MTRNWLSCLVAAVQATSSFGGKALPDTNFSNLVYDADVTQPTTGTDATAAATPESARQAASFRQGQQQLDPADIDHADSVIARRTAARTPTTASLGKVGFAWCGKPGYWGWL